MIISGELSLAQQRTSRKWWLVFNMLNAASFVCVADNVLYLFAIEMGCPQYILPIIASFMYIGFMAMPLGKLLTARIGATYSISFFWISRNLFALFTASAPWVMELTHSAWAGIAVVLTGAFGFYASRSAGVVSMNPVMGEITDTHIRGKFNSTQLSTFNSIAIIGLAAISLIMKKYSSLSTYQCIILFGACAGFCGGYVMTRVTESNAPRESAREPVWDSFRKALRDRLGKKLIIANVAGLSGIVIVLPVSLAALKSGYGVSDSVAILFVLVQFFGGIVISVLSGIVSREAGPRPVVIISFSLLLVSCLMWIMAPTEFIWFYVFWIFLLNGAGGTGTPMALSHYFLNAVPAKSRISYSLLVSLIAGPTAGLFSFVVGSGLLKLLPHLGCTGMNLYRIYFCIVPVMLIVFLVMLMTLERLRDWNVGKLLGLALAPRDFRALLLLNKVDKTVSPSQEIENIERLGHVHSELTADKILDYLETPKYLVRSKALMALREVPFGEKVENKLIEELKYGTYTTAPLAAMILGERGVSRAVPFLRKQLESDNVYLVGRVTVALAQLNDQFSLDRIKKIFVETDNQFLIINSAAALNIIGDPEALELLLEKTLQDGLDRSVRAEIYSVVAEMGDVGDAFYRLFKLFFTRKELRNSLCLGFFEELHTDPLSKELIKSVNKINKDETDSADLIKLIIDATSGSSLKLLNIIGAFLQNAPHERLKKILLFCLAGICRKNGRLL